MKQDTIRKSQWRALMAAILPTLALGACQQTEGKIVAAPASQHCLDQRNLALVNGDIHLMDEAGTIASSVFIRAGHVASIGEDDYSHLDCTDVINLRGRTAIPGLIDNHVHFVRIQNLPGHDMREIETTFTVADALTAISAKASTIPRGELITALGGFKRQQWAENRFPTREELDAAAPHNPVYISEFAIGPGQVNTAARDLLRYLDAPVSNDGEIGELQESFAAYNALTTNRNDDDRRAQLQRTAAWANSVGLTTVMDMSGTIPGPGFLDQRTGYDPIVSLDRDNELTLRTRLYLPALDEDDELKQLQGRLDNTFHNFGSDMLKIVGIGEWSVGRALFNTSPLADGAVDAQRRMAERGWTYHQHLHSPAEIDAHLDVWEALDPEFDLSDLRWTAGHMSGAQQDHIDRVIALGLGIGVHGQPYLDGHSGPPWRAIVESDAVAKGGGSDGARISPINPWVMIYSMVTGRDHTGTPVNVENAITRQQAVRLYSSAEQGWFTKEDDTLGGIDIGRFGDIIVLNQNVFDEDAVSDDDIRHTLSSLTIVGGKIVHSDGSLSVGDR